VGTKTVRFSDLTQTVVEDEAEFGRLVVEHPDFPDPVPLDVLPKEVDKDLTSAERYVLLTYTRPGESSSERFVLDLDTFNGLAKGRSMEEVLQDALATYRAQQTLQRRQQAAAPQPEARRRAAPSGQTPKKDYASLDFAGEPHRGRITDAEKRIVQEHFDEVNKRLSEKGLRPIDPADPKMKERFGLDKTT
jgi:hypothetical protein